MARRVIVLPVVLMTLCAAPLEAVTSREITAQAFAQAYNLEFTSAHALLEEAARLDRSDPAPARAAAAITWMEALFFQGAATFEAFTGQASKDDVGRPVPPPALALQFKTQIERARLLAEARLTSPADADAHYQMGATAALSAIYAATVEGRTAGALREGRRAVREMELARKLAPALRETGLVLGMSEYTVSTMGWAARTFAALFGLSGNKADGLRLLEEAAQASTETEHDALLVLMIVYSREGAWPEATSRLARLQARFPRNRLLVLNRGALAIEGRDFAAAEGVLAAPPPPGAVATPPIVTGERALWLLKLGTARAALGRAEQAAADLAAVLDAGPREWVRGRAHYQLARLALVRHDRAAALQQLELAVSHSKRGGDEVAVRAAEQLRSQTRRSP